MECSASSVSQHLNRAHFLETIFIQEELIKSLKNEHSANLENAVHNFDKD
jgi:hypothetical protein